eukprot:6210744-Pleurochrysis_carterae.AAC.1
MSLGQQPRGIHPATMYQTFPRLTNPTKVPAQSYITTQYPIQPATPISTLIATAVPTSFTQQRALCATRLCPPLPVQPDTAQCCVTCYARAREGPSAGVGVYVRACVSVRACASVRARVYVRACACVFLVRECGCVPESVRAGGRAHAYVHR